MNRFNIKHGILFLKTPPVEWTWLFGIMYVNEIYHCETVDYNEEYHKNHIRHTYNGNYNKLQKFIFD